MGRVGPGVGEDCFLLTHEPQLYGRAPGGPLGAAAQRKWKQGAHLALVYPCDTLLRLSPHGARLNTSVMVIKQNNKDPDDSRESRLSGCHGTKHFVSVPN